MVSGYALLLFIPLSPVLRYVVNAQAGWVFFTSIVAIAVLADWIRRATEQLAGRAGSTMGGLLNVSFGNSAELVLALFVLRQGQIHVVQAQITGSIIGTTLLFLGISALVGGFGRTRQTFNQANAGLLSTLLFLVVLAILLPAVFDFTQRLAAPGANPSMTDERLSLGVSVVLLLLYAANLVYTLVTHRDMFAAETPCGAAKWSLGRALIVMTAGTGLIAVEAELASAALEPTSVLLGLSPVFMGVVVLALVGTVADLFAAVVFARRNNMDIVFSMCLGSAIQIALVVAPILVLTSWAMGHPMNLVFASPLDLFAIASAAFIVRSVSGDGETTWFEGLLLVGVYLLFALAYYFERPV
ncbi:MAG TPA: calcium/proton exchanger [Stellaceae bacterium]|nr:calcium/proton exchanger [Stellaceae bacterium]